MTTRTFLSAALLLALSSCLLAACGVGGAIMGGIRAESVDPPKPIPPPQTGPCPSPVTADCTVDAAYTLTWDEGTQMTGGRQSDHALVVKGSGWLNLKYGDYRFSGGTTIVEDATLVVWDSLISNVHVTAPGAQGSGSPTLWLGGTLHGNLDNDNIVSLRHRCGTGLNICVQDHYPVINGNFKQSASAELDVVLGWPLQITGKATVDGKLGFLRGTSQSYVLPSAPSSVLVLHADGGVFGQFANWASEYGLFITGAVRYLPNDVLFDITTISAAQVMGTAKAEAFTVRAADNFDAALGNADKWARNPDVPLTPPQRQFLASVGAIQRIQDYGQATRTFDSLSGHGYADAADALLQQAAMPGPELMVRVANVRTGKQSGTWSTPTSMLAAGGGAVSGVRTGFDQWLGDRYLLGVSFGASEGSLRFDRAGGGARDQSPQWDMYVRRNGSADSYVFGDVGYSRHQLNLNRQIDLGIGQQLAGARPNFDVLRAYLETGRDFRVAASRLTPFAGMSHAMLRGAGFIEQGSTGFELIAQPATYQRLNAVAGLRLGADWRSNGGRWTTLNLTTGYRQLLHVSDDTRAAFTGTPAVTFALDGTPARHGSGWLQMNLATGGQHWNWLLSYDRQASDQALSLGTTFRF